MIIVVGSWVVVFTDGCFIVVVELILDGVVICTVNDEVGKDVVVELLRK